jgi:hypothetical protein
VKWTGRAVQPKKRWAIPPHQPEVLARIGNDGEAFIACAAHFLGNKKNAHVC